MKTNNDMKPAALTQELVRELFHYDVATGILTNRVNRGGLAKQGERAGCVHTANGYRNVLVLGKLYGEHRIIWMYVTGSFPQDQLDHINGIRDDNRIANLREVTNQENGKNRRKHNTNTSGHAGVSWHRAANKWQAQIRADGRAKHLGYFTNIEDAILARQAANIQYGFHQNHGRG
jgi:hypothetical protein